MDELSRRFKVEKAVDVNDCPGCAAEYGFESVPTFVLMGQRGMVARVHGFTGGRDLLSRLVPGNIEGNGAPQPKRRESLKPIPVEPQGPGITEVVKENGYLQRTIRAMEQKESRSRTAAKEAAQREQRMLVEIQRLRTETTEITRDARSVIEQTASRVETIRADAERRIQALAKTRETTETTTPLPDGHASGSVVPDPESSETVASWKSFAATAVKIGVTLAAPQYVMPVMAGLSVLGLGLNWRKKKGQSSPRGSPDFGDRRQNGFIESNAKETTIDVVAGTTVDRIQTENHYVEKEVDYIGNAYKESLRRVSAAMKGRSPQVVEFVKQIDHTATELIRGHKVNTRPEPKDGAIWSDKESY